MIELDHASMGYPGRTVLKDLNLKLDDHQIIALIGENGSGKSTFFKTLLGLIPLRSGTILINGQNLETLSEADRASMMAALMQQHPIPSMPVFQLVLHGRYARASWPRGYTEKDRQIALQALEAMGIADLKDRMMNRLSAGQMQKVWMAMVLAQQTDWIFLDEPNTALDQASMMDLADRLKDLKQEGRSLLVIIHDLAFALEIADWIVCLKDQGILFAGTPQGFIDHNVAEKAFGLQVLEVEAGGKKRILLERMSASQ